MFGALTPNVIDGLKAVFDLEASLITIKINPAIMTIVTVISADLFMIIFKDDGCAMW